MKRAILLLMPALLAAQVPAPSPQQSAGGGGGGSLPSGSAIVVGSGVPGNTIPATSFDPTNNVGGPALTLDTINGPDLVAPPENTITLTAALAGAGAGDIPNGWHHYTVSYETQPGSCGQGTMGAYFLSFETEATSGVASYGVEVLDHTTNGQINITNIPLSADARVVGRCLYRTVVNANNSNLQNYYLLGEVGDNTTTTYRDDIADTGLGSPQQDVNTSVGYTGVFDRTSSCGGMPCNAWNIGFWQSIRQSFGGQSLALLGGGMDYFFARTDYRTAGFDNRGVLSSPPSADASWLGGWAAGDSTNGGLEGFSAAHPEINCTTNISVGCLSSMLFEAGFGLSPSPSNASFVSVPARKPGIIFSSYSLGSGFLRACKNDFIMGVGNYENLANNDAAQPEYQSGWAVIADDTCSPLTTTGYVRAAINPVQDAPPGSFNVHPALSAEPGIVIMAANGSAQTAPLLAVVPYATSSTFGAPTFAINYQGDYGGTVDKPTVLFSAAGTALPTCNTTAKGWMAVVSDATVPIYNATYTSGGAVIVPVICDGTNWKTH